MTVSYGKLWQLCVERDIKTSKLVEDGVIGASTLYEMHKNSPVALQMIDKLCSYFKCQPDEIMEFV